MAATFTVTIVSRDRDNNRQVREADVAIGGTYTTGGDVLSPGLFGLRHITDMSVVGRAGTAPHGRQLVLAGTTDTPLVKQFNGSTAEVASGAALSGTVRVRVKGY